MEIVLNYGKITKTIKKNNLIFIEKDSNLLLFRKDLLNWLKLKNASLPNGEFIFGPLALLSNPLIQGLAISMGNNFNSPGVIDDFKTVKDYKKERKQSVDESEAKKDGINICCLGTQDTGKSTFIKLFQKDTMSLKQDFYYRTPVINHLYINILETLVALCQHIIKQQEQPEYQSREVKNIKLMDELVKEWVDKGYHNYGKLVYSENLHMTVLTLWRDPLIQHLYQNEKIPFQIHDGHE